MEECEPTALDASAEGQEPVDEAVTGCPEACPRCTAEITDAQLQDIFPDATDEKITDTAAAFNGAFEAFEINTCLRKAHFFAQIREEVGSSIAALAENMNYSEAALKKTFRYFRNAPEEATLYGRNDDHPADQQAIGNRAYANRLGNGDIDSGDGWQYRGKGYIQLTGKSNYQAVQDEIDAEYPESDVDIIANPDDILEAEGAMVSAMAFWSMNNINTAADGGTADSDVNAVTEIINVHTDSYEERREHFETTKEAFQVDECPDLEEE